jgi:Tfp pilus assembly protein PilO
MKYRAKTKIYLWFAVWAALTGLVLGYVFKGMDQANQNILAEISKAQAEKGVLAAERDSYNQAKQDLAAMQKKNLQPQDFFSQDVTLVAEIKTLEALGEKLNVTFDLSGLSGTVKTVPKANTLSAILAVPYSISLKGTFGNVVAFIETMENLDFITTLNSVSLAAGSGKDSDLVIANLTANFYLRQP